MKRIFLILAGFFFGYTQPLSSVEPMTSIILDVRTAQEYDTSHIEGSILIPYDQIAHQINNTVKDKSQKIVVYCRSGRRSKIAKDTLNQLGYKNISDLGSIQNASRILNRKIIQNK